MAAGGFFCGQATSTNLSTETVQSMISVSRRKNLCGARVLLPALREVPIEAVRIAIRPEPVNSYSAIGRLPGVKGLHVAITHSGVTLAPFIGEGLTREILHSQEVPEFAAFRPARFFREQGI